MTRKYEIIHSVDVSGLSPYFPDPSIREGDIEKDGWPVGTIRVEYDHAEHCTTVVIADDTYTVDIEGYGHDIDRGEFFIDRDGVHFRADEPERF